MWDLTVASDHDFYVDTVAGTVLVHNCPIGPSESWGNPDSLEATSPCMGRTSVRPLQRTMPTRLRSSSSGIQDNMPIKIDEEGVIRLYDPDTNTFGAYNPSGTTRTFF